MVTLSIITINYNNKKGLLKTIDSIKEQSFTDFEWIIIDGGSTDGSVEIIRENESRIAYWISKHDKGVYDAMNKGILHANGLWLNFMNSGDTFERKDTLRNVFSENIPESAHFLYSDTVSEMQDGNIKISYQNHLKGNIIHQSSIYKKQLHEQYGYYIVTPKIIISDLLFFLSIPEEYFHKVKTIIANFELGGISSSGTWCVKQKMCALVVYRKMSFGALYYKYLLLMIKGIVRKIIVWFRTYFIGK